MNLLAFHWDMRLLGSSRHLVTFPIKVLSQQFDLLSAELVGLWMMPNLVPQAPPLQRNGKEPGFEASRCHYQLGTNDVMLHQDIVISVLCSR